ncbi:MAG: TonB-dependent receptor domain-containing protein [Gemmatimonadota bacterium]
MLSPSLLMGLMLTAAVGDAQTPDSRATVRLRAMHGATPLGGVRVASGDTAVDTGADGIAVLRLAPGPAALLLTRIGYIPATTRLSLSPGQDTALTVDLAAQALELETVVVAATRSERRVEDTPLRVEVVDEEEVAEKAAMTPGDIAMMLNETSGLRVQTTSPSLGGANVRVQGLRGRYTLLLADGLPLYGGQAGGLGLLQIPPLDLARAEIIKGAASALYGTSALGGVVNLVSRRPADRWERHLLINQTSRGGTDGVLFTSLPLEATSPWGATLLASAHRQRTNDLDDDGWADMPGYNRLVLRPRLFYSGPTGQSVMVTAGYTGEQRDGGTLPGSTAPDGSPYPEALRTRRGDVGVAVRLVPNGRDVLSVRGSAMEQRHRHQFGAVFENDVHRTGFVEMSYAWPRERSSFVIGSAFQVESYTSEVAGFDYDFRIPALFAQGDLDLSRQLAVSASARLDHHSQYGGMVSPRISSLLRGGTPDALRWSVRISGGAGAFAPVPFTEETEVTGLSPLRPLPALEVERALGGSLDVNVARESERGRIEANATVFASRIAHPVFTLADSGTTPAGAGFIQLANAPSDTRTAGAELLLRVVRGRARVTASYVFIEAHEWNDDVGTGARRAVPLVPRHSAGLVASLEWENVRRVGLEVYYTGRQHLLDNPYRTGSEPFVIVGFLAEQTLRVGFGQARIFVNAENVTNVRQTRHDPLTLPARGEGGRWTTDVWSDLAGFTLNGGAKVMF